ncbi:MAG: (Fe-S)-binding protein [Candidatus Kapaibacteriales bacterium]
MREIIFIILTVFAFGFLFFNFFRLYKIFKFAKPEKRTDNFWLRLRNTFKIALFQSKILRDPVAGLVHVGIFWGFLIFLFSASESVFQGFDENFSWSILGFFYTVISFSTDIFIVIILISVFIALLRRFVFKIQRLQLNKSETFDAIMVLGSIFIITVSLLIYKSAKITAFGLDDWAFMPISKFLSSFFNVKSSGLYYEIFWWVHILCIYLFMNYLFYSKHFHVFTSFQNVFFRDPLHFSKLERINFDVESADKFGVQDFEDLGWKSLHDAFSCTHCGRCDSVCPANLTGKELSPRQIIIEIRHRTIDKGKVLLKKQFKTAYELSDNNGISPKKFIGDYINPNVLWQCTTCGACVYECPISIEHLNPIIGMRRSQVLMEAKFPTLLQNVFSNLENNGAPWQFSQSDRADWANGLNVRIASQIPNFEYLFWVGCAGSFDERAKKIARAFVQILNNANIDFAILGSEEVCNGDVARRAGNEYLADYLIKTNVESFKKYNVKKVLTICPHCFNIFKNEYPDYGISLEVYHHTTFIFELMKQGKIFIKEVNSSAVYHDSCYIGRYNSIFDEPRSILKKIFNDNYKEPLRTKDRGLCCGAGGGMMFLEESKGKRINLERTEELLSSKTNIIAVNCPFCMTMLSDGVKSKNKEDEVVVKDIAELVAENLD